MSASKGLLLIRVAPVVTGEPKSKIGRACDPFWSDYFLSDVDVGVIVDTLQHIKQTALPEDVA